MISVKELPIKGLKAASAASVITVFPIIIPKQDLYQGAGSVTRIPQILKRASVKKPVVVTDAVLMKLGVLDGLFNALKEASIEYAVYDGVEPNPAIENIEAAYEVYKNNNCDSIIGFGGGSAMDCAKVLSGRVIKPRTSVEKMGRLGGYFPISIPAFKLTPFTVAVPTTAGTGAETTVAAVVSDHKKDRKYTITDTAIRPNCVVLDPQLATGLPPYPTACTAIDAMSHCIEGYIGWGHNPRTDEYAEKGVRMIFENIDKATTNGKDIEARGQLCLAAYYGGLSLNGATTGYVHPFCHKIGAKYGLVHGRCIAAVLPIMLDYYGEKAEKRLAIIGVASGVSDPGAPAKIQSKQFIAAIREFNEKFGIAPTIPEIQEKDFEEIADSIMAENLPYPTPVILSKEEIFNLLRKIKGE